MGELVVIGVYSPCDACGRHVSTRDCTLCDSCMDTQARSELTASELFFYMHAGYSYDPRTETKFAGKIRTAKRLARAERIACERGYVYDVARDLDYTSAGEFDAPDTQYYACAMYSTCDNDSNALPVPRLLASLGGIDVDEFHPHMRVVRAELALEVLGGSV